MSTPIRHLLPTLLLMLLATVAIALLTIDRRPNIWRAQSAGHRDIAATRHLIYGTVRNSQAHDKLRTIALTEDDLAAIGNFALMRKKLDGYVQASIHQSRLDALVTIRLFDGFYVNAKLVADDDEPQAVIKQIKLGRLALPHPLVRWFGWWLMQVTPLGRYGQMAAPLVREVRISDERLRVTLNWSREAIDQAQSMVTDLASKERLLAYHSKLAELVNRPGLKRYVSFGSLSQPLFALAKERSMGEDADPVDENRALIVVLGAYVNNRNLTPLLAHGDAPALDYHGVLLNRRLDAAQHFMASAALAISGHNTLADMVGLAKEINDTHSGSGFSFTDLASDRAGAQFGKTAVRSDADARKVQDLLSQGTDESVFMPTLRDLPENLNASDFGARFKDIESAEFLALKQRIEQRIAACALYQ